MSVNPAQLEAALARAERAEKLCEARGVEIEHLKRERVQFDPQRLMEQLESSRNQIDTLKQELERKNAQIKHFESSVEQLTKINCIQLEKWESALVEIERVKKERDEAQRMVTIESDEHTGWKHRFSELQSRCDKLEAALREAFAYLGHSHNCNAYAGTRCTCLVEAVKSRAAQLIEKASK